MRNQKGQVLILLLLTLLVGLSVGLVMTQRSISDVSQSTQNDQSSRALFAAEAGIENALSGSSKSTINVGTNTTATVTPDLIPTAGNALEYPPFGRDTIAQFWMIDPTSKPLNDSDSDNFSGSKFRIFFGNEQLLTAPDSTRDYPAIAVTVITKDSAGVFKSFRYYYDSRGQPILPETTSRASQNGFCSPADSASALICSTSGRSVQTQGVNGTRNSVFYCEATVPPPIISSCSTPATPAYSGTPYIVRVRYLFTNVDSRHKMALEPIGDSLPPQVDTYMSVGTFGQSRRVIRAFRQHDVVPPFFDFALFSLGEIAK